ncbi:hypothetical protein HID58_057412 [Brassica napus]|uniref:Uncharacterized protein n=1 Tax=Brassica napus TaxID=3708 RepID=A0ABQ8ARW5_BRANA|nr:hypothetical protein HID58_057412 [Brassica napus]
MPQALKHTRFSPRSLKNPNTDCKGWRHYGAPAAMLGCSSVSVDLTSGMAVPLCLETRRRVFFLSPPQRVEVHTISRTCEAVKLLRLTAVRVLELSMLCGRGTFRGLWKLDLVSAVSNGGGSVLLQSSSPQPYIFSV